MESKEYYARLLSINPRYIGDLNESSLSDPSRTTTPNHFGLVNKVIIPVIGRQQIILVEKKSTPEVRLKRGHENIDIYEATVLKVLNSAIPQRVHRMTHYVVPTFCEHRVDTDRAIVTHYIPARSFTSRLDELDEMLNKSKEDAYIEKLNNVKNAYILLAFRALAEFQYDLREKLVLTINEELQKSKTSYETMGLKVLEKIFDPRVQENYYCRKIIENLRSLLEEFNIKSTDDCIKRLNETNCSGKSPLAPFNELEKIAEGHYITSDFRPANLRLIIESALGDDIARYLKTITTEQDDIEVMEKITERGKVGIVDLSDLRIGPSLFDFVDLAESHELRLREQSVRKGLRYFSNQMYRLDENQTGHPDSLFAESLDEYDLHNIYKAVRNAAKTNSETEKRHYLKSLRGSISRRRDLEEFRRIIRGPLESMINKLETNHRFIPGFLPGKPQHSNSRNRREPDGKNNPKAVSA